MNRPWLSIIIPVYNPPLDLFQKCLESLQTISIPMEVLLIDDGSDEKIADYCKNLCSSSIRYYRQENQGVSTARNLGIAHAAGKYVFFLDSDDKIPPEFGKFLAENYQRLTADWIIFGIRELDPSSGIVQEREDFPATETIWSKKDVLTELVCQSKVNESWGKLIRRAVLLDSGVLFPSKSVQGEDATFNIRLLKAVSSIQTIPCPGYLYRYEKNTQTRRILRDPKRFFQSLQISYFEKKEIIEEMLAGSEQIKQLEQWKITAIEETGSTMLKLWKGKCFSVQERQLVKDYLGKTGCMENLSMSKIPSLKIRIYYGLLKHEFWWGFWVLSLFKK